MPDITSCYHGNIDMLTRKNFFKVLFKWHEDIVAHV